MELERKLNELGTAWEEFKKINDQKLEAEKKGREGAAKELGEKLAKAENHIQSLETKITDLNAALARTQAPDQAPGMTEGQKLMAEYKAAVVDYVRGGKEIDKNLRLQAEKAMSIDSETGGGFLVTPEVAGEITKKVHEGSPIRQLASVISISTSSFRINADLDARSASWVGERASRSATTPPTVRQDEIFVHEMYCYPEATQNFLDDAAVNVEAWLADFCAEGFALTEATAFISGNGVQKPRGILSYAEGTAYGQIQRVDTEATGAIAANDLISVQTALKEPYQKNAVWLINRTTIGVIRKIKDVTSGQYIWQPGLQESTPSILLGRPVMMAADLNTALTASTDGLAIYGDFRAGYQIVDRVGIRVLRDPYSSKPNVGFYTTKRVGGGVKNYEALKVLNIKD